MTAGLIGSTGFVGATIARQRKIDVGYHRSDIADVRGTAYASLWIAGAPAEKWIANARPEADLANLRDLVGHLEHVRAAQVVLVSTVDVYPEPVGVDETTHVDVDDNPQAYGRNRLWLEEAVRDLFARTLVVRLPGLFGTGLRKNLVYDLLHGRGEFAHRESTYQFYDMNGLCLDVERALAAGLQTVNLATEPIGAQDIASGVFDRVLERVEGQPARYDVRTRHANLYGRSKADYLHGRDEVLERLRRFVVGSRSGTA